jgi:phytoene synthase
MTSFYAFCRVVDDIADEPGPTVDEKRVALARWADVIEGRIEPKSPVEVDLVDLLKRYPGIDPELAQEILRGMEMDLGTVRYRTRADLERYCYRVACAVGLVSIEIFGCKAPGAKAYAIELGHALQLTNILRDVGEDWRESQRIYLPEEEMERFGVTEADLAAETSGERFRLLMASQAERAKERFAAARRLYPHSDRKALRASELMRSFYESLLRKMERGGYRVLEHRYRLGALEKVALLIRESQTTPRSISNPVISRCPKAISAFVFAM